MFIKAKGYLRNEMIQTRRLLISTKNWFLSSASIEPSRDADVVLLFSNEVDGSGVAWLLDLLKQRVELLSLRSVYLEKFKCFAVFCSASYRSLLSGAESVALRKRLLPEFGGGYQEFTVDGFELFEHATDESIFFNSQERQTIVKHLLDSLLAQKGDCLVLSQSVHVDFVCGQAIVPLLESMEHVQVYPLHEKEALKLLSRRWVQTWFNSQPLDDVQQYFGVKIAMYFAWLGHYTTALIFPSVLGLLMWAMTTEEYKEVTYMILSISNILWATVYLEHWKRHSCTLAHRWGTLYSGSELLDKPRSLFRGRLQPCPVTGRLVPYYPEWKRLIARYCISAPVILLCLFCVFQTMLCLFHFQEWLDSSVDQNSWWGTVICYLPKILLAVSIGCMDEVYKRIALKLNDFENFKFEKSYNNHMIVKLVLFHFVNSFLALFYIAFVLQDLQHLKEQLAALVITRQIVGNMKEIGMPFIVAKFRQFRMGIEFERHRRNSNSCVSSDHVETVSHNSSDDIQNDASDALNANSFMHLSQCEEEATMPAYEDPYEDYLEMFVQFGYVSMFACVFPLAGIFCLANNILEVHSDAFKLTTSFRRPFGRDVSSIGVWQDALELMGIAAVMVNIGLMGVSGALSKFVDGSPVSLILTLVALEHVLLALKQAIACAIPDVPNWVQESMARREFLCREAFKKLEKENVREKKQRSDSQGENAPQYDS